MPAALLAVLPSILDYAVQYGLPAARQIIALIHNPAPTLDDWNKSFDVAESNAKTFLDATK